MADTIQAKIAELEAEMARTQKNKATNYHLVCYACLCVIQRIIVQSIIKVSSDTRNELTHGHCRRRCLIWLVIFWIVFLLILPPCCISFLGYFESQDRQVEERTDSRTGREKRWFKRCRTWFWCDQIGWYSHWIGRISKVRMRMNRRGTQSTLINRSRFQTMKRFSSLQNGSDFTV
jgi:hypothetical protein